jgi:hypothetical protein
MDLRWIHSCPSPTTESTKAEMPAQAQPPAGAKGRDARSHQARNDVARQLRLGLLCERRGHHSTTGLVDVNLLATLTTNPSTDDATELPCDGASQSVSKKSKKRSIINEQPLMLRVTRLCDASRCAKRYGELVNNNISNFAIGSERVAT